MDLFKELFSNFALLLTILGVIAFFVSLITEVTKNLGFLKRIPTDLQVIFLAILLCQLAYFGYSAYFSVEIQWYYITGGIIAAFIVAYVDMFGWEKLSALYNRFKK